jgi:hypothetical protein
MMAAATVPGANGPEVLWWAAFTHGTPPVVAGTFINDLLSPEPVVRTTSDLPRPGLLALVTTSRPATTPRREPGPDRRQAGR